MQYSPKVGKSESPEEKVQKLIIYRFPPCPP
jgi:hypothetical protein